MERSQDNNTTQKGDVIDIKTYRPISLLSHMYKLFTRILQKIMERLLKENQPSFRKGNSTVDHLQTINQLIEKCIEIKRPLRIGYIDNEKAVDSIEHEAIFKTLRSIGMNEAYITNVEDTNTCAAARVHMENQVSEEITRLRGVRQGHPISPKLFTVTIQEAFKSAHLEEKAINFNIEGEKAKDRKRWRATSCSGRTQPRIQQNRIFIG